MFTGYGGTIKKWSKSFIEKLSESFQVILFNYPGVEKSNLQKKTSSFDDYCDFIDEIFRETNNNKNYILFGFSMGTYVLRNYLIKNKDIKPLFVVMCSGSYGGKYRKAPSEDVMKKLNTAGRSNLDLLFSSNYIPNFNEYISSFLYPTEEQSSQELLNQQNSLIQKFYEEMCSDDLEKAINHDTLIIHGKNDLIMPFLNAEILSSFCLKEMQLFSTDGGHLHLFEYPSEIADQIKNFSLKKGIK